MRIGGISDGRLVAASVADLAAGLAILGLGTIVWLCDWAPDLAVYAVVRMAITTSLATFVDRQVVGHGRHG